MKKILLTTLLLICAGIVQAQLKVNTTGNVAIADNPSSINKLRIHSEEYDGIYVSSSPGIYSAGTGLTVYASSNANPSTIYGVKSTAKGATGINMAVYGYVNVKGAAIFGSTNGYAPSLSLPYAGYFDGNVHTQGNLTTSGSINGTLLSPLPSGLYSLQESAYSSMESIPEVSSLFNDISASSFYHNQNRLRTAKKQQIEMSDSPVEVKEEELPLSFMEKQVLAKRHFTLDAEQIEKLFPDLVYENEDGTKSINYVEMVPILVQAIGELKSEINELKGNDSARKVSAKTTGINDVDGSVEVLALGQNKPNPFGTSTEIEVSVPQSVQSAFVYVYDLQGKKVQQVDITARGKQTVELNAIGLSDGMYLYSLIADGKVVETRRMIVEK